MKRAVPVLISVFALGGALTLSGCEVSSHSCVNGRCHVTVSGTGKTFDINDVDVKVTEISGAWVSVTANGSAPTRISVGDSSRVGPVTIKVTSIKGQTVKFDME
ncbi:hypothetical protein [Actinomadura sp. BRA 177]|uniref:hypothetical protein n=1 Tax=Actinomadura sp. BRA 177 TaxID=2745202 RepID=UPI001596283B|nr:hypothetical protein [Actinomadura sp. BRA 177]NVI88445.1 hypothetical protein [Actinomadura sp. BRA 177]